MASSHEVPLQPSSPSSLRPLDDAATTGMGNNHDQDADDAEVWKCGDPYKYPIPKANGLDSWDTLFQRHMRKDNVKCDSWKDEVQNLLIFAGLFSAVVTAFVVESYKWLQEDPDDVLIRLLSHISDRLDGTNSSARAFVTQTGSAGTQFVPSASSTRVNIFWFISLILSLATVLIGIISLQWLREYQAYPGLTAKHSFSLFHMRSQALKQWKVPEIFTLLPLLLQAALILFFVGMIDFLTGLGRGVAIPVSVVIGGTLLFFAATTVLPALQSMKVMMQGVPEDRESPIQCPYKSPQSFAFQRLLSTVFKASSPAFTLAYSLCRNFVRVKPSTKWRFRIMFLRLKNFIRPVSQKVSKTIYESWRSVGKYLSSLNTARRELESHPLVPETFAAMRGGNWTNIDQQWLRMRDILAICHHLPTSERDLYVYRKVWTTEIPMYDLVRGLHEVLGEEIVMNGAESDVILSCYHCFQDVSLSVLGPASQRRIRDSGFGNLRRRNRYLRALLKGKFSVEEYVNRDHTTQDGNQTEYFSDVLKKPAFELLHEENLLTFTKVILRGREPPPELLRHFGELTLRLIGYLYVSPRALVKYIHLNGQNVRPHSRMPALINMETLGLLSEQKGVVETAFSRQWVLTLKSYFDLLSKVNITTEEPILFSFHAHRYLHDFMLFCTYQGLTPNTDVINSILNSIARTLDTAMKSDSRAHDKDLLFYATSIYIRFLLMRQSRFEPLRNQLDGAINGVLKALQAYKAYLSPHGNKRAEEYIGIPSLSDQNWWHFLESSGTNIVTLEGAYEGLLGNILADIEDDIGAAEGSWDERKASEMISIGT